MPAFDPLALLAVLAAFRFGGVVKGAMGFGLPLVTIAILPFLMEVETALAVNAVVLAATNIYQVMRSGRWREGMTIAAPVMAGLVVATPLGAALATAMPRAVLLGLLGGFIVAFALQGLTGIGTGRARKGPVPLWRNLAAGAAGGVVGAFTSTPGPVFVMHLAHLGLERGVFMATLGLLMGAVGVVLAASLAVAGPLDGGTATLGAVACLPAFAGFRAGDALGARLSGPAVRKGVLWLLALLGATMLYGALTGG